MSNITPSNFATPGTPLDTLAVTNPGDAANRAAVANRNAASVLGAQTRIVAAEAAQAARKASLFTASGTWAVPAGATVIEVVCQGGGGGGGGGGSAALTGGITGQSGGSGGGAGGYVSHVISAPPAGTVLGVTVGAGGVTNGGGAASTGTTGNPGLRGNDGGSSSLKQGTQYLVAAYGGHFGRPGSANSASAPVGGLYAVQGGTGQGAPNTVETLGVFGNGGSAGRPAYANGPGGVAGGGGGGPATLTNGGGGGQALIGIATGLLAGGSGASSTLNGIDGIAATVPGCAGGGGGGGAPGGAGGNGGVGAAGWVSVRVIG